MSEFAQPGCIDTCPVAQQIMARVSELEQACDGHLVQMGYYSDQYGLAVQKETESAGRASLQFEALWKKYAAMRGSQGARLANEDEFSSVFLTPDEFKEEFANSSAYEVCQEARRNTLRIFDQICLLEFDRIIDQAAKENLPPDKVEYRTRVVRAKSEKRRDQESQNWADAAKIKRRLYEGFIAQAEALGIIEPSEDDGADVHLSKVFEGLFWNQLEELSADEFALDVVRSALQKIMLCKGIDPCPYK